jgi:hypothetical protein
MLPSSGFAVTNAAPCDVLEHRAGLMLGERHERIAISIIRSPTDRAGWHLPHLFPVGL